ncbi:phage major capsid protein [Rhizobium sp. PAMB 3174]
MKTSGVHGAGQERTQAVTDEALIQALAYKIGGAEPQDERGRALAGRSLISIAREVYTARGYRADNFSDGEIADMVMGGAALQGQKRGEHTTSDFPVLLMESGDRVLMERFSADPSALKMFSRKRNSSDFRPQTHIRPGEAPLLLKVAESGEVKYGTLGTEAVSFAVETYARGFRLSRKAIINDDLGAFSDFLYAFSDASQQTEGNLFFEILSANAFGGKKYSDNKNFFHADHGNLAAVGEAPSVATLSAARKAMRLQANVNGTGTAGVTPKYLVVGPLLETLAQQVVAEINATKTDDVNPFSSQLQVVVENRYGGQGWWLFADPAKRPAFLHGYLEGRDGPFFVRHEVASVAAGAVFECILDFGCGPYEYRAAYFNPGE